MNTSILRKNIFLFIICAISLSIEEDNQLTLKLEVEITKEELEIIYINKKEQTENEEDCNQCEKWIASLFNPLLLVHQNINITDKTTNQEMTVTLPVFPKPIFVKIYNNSFWDKYKVITGKIMYNDEINSCYLGLLNNIGDYPKIDETQVFLNYLINNKIFTKKIFSFDKWDITKSSIQSSLYLGFNHDNFNQKKKKGIIGSCKANLDKYWGCSFNQISFNNNSPSSKENENFTSYKIYFSSENYNIIFPKYFEDQFNEITNKSCNYEDDIEFGYLNLTCNFFDDNKYANLTLIDDNMEITVEIDNIYRFSLYEDKENNKTRIRYVEGIDYFIFPLIMFKNFHIQFDAENNLINFYTTDNSILKLKKDNNKEKGSSSKGLTVFIVILVIVIVIALTFGLFWFLKKRKGSFEKSINKYNKFEDEENFQSMNEKRVF